MPDNDFTRSVTLGDDTVLNGSAGLNTSADELWVWLDDDTDMQTAFQLFYDPSKTSRIRADLTGAIFETFTGYTKLALIREDNGKITIRMKRGATDGK